MRPGQLLRDSIPSPPGRDARGPGGHRGATLATPALDGLRGAETGSNMSADYRATVFLPRTEFPMKARLPQREPEILERWRERRRRSPADGG